MTTGRRTPIGPAAMLVGGALLVLGSFLTWFTFTGPDVSESGNGIDGGDGWITLGAGVVVIAAGIAALKAGRRALGVLALLAGLVGAGVGLYDALSARDQLSEEVAVQNGISEEQARQLVDEVLDSDQYELSIGIGLYLVIAGGAIGLVGGLMQAAAGSGPAGAPSMPGTAPPIAAMPPASTPSAGGTLPPTPPAPAPPPDTPPA
jgi:hypothetical protein